MSEFEKETYVSSRTRNIADNFRLQMHVANEAESVIDDNNDKREVMERFLSSKFLGVIEKKLRIIPEQTEKRSALKNQLEEDLFTYLGAIHLESQLAEHHELVYPDKTPQVIKSFYPGSNGLTPEGLILRWTKNPRRPTNQLTHIVNYRLASESTDHEHEYVQELKDDNFLRRMGDVNNPMNLRNLGHVLHNTGFHNGAERFIRGPGVKMLWVVPNDVHGYSEDGQVVNSIYTRREIASFADKFLVSGRFQNKLV